jgi:hypothetical protein
MSKEKEKEMNVEDEITAIKKQLTEFSGWRRRISTNWKQFVRRYVGDAELKKGSDGELGFVSPRLIGAMLVSFAVVVGLAIAVSTNSTDIAHWGTAAIRADGSYVTDGNVVSGGGVYTNATATQTPTLVSNATLKVYGLTQVVANNGTITVGTNVTVTIGTGSTLPAASLSGNVALARLTNVVGTLNYAYTGAITNLSITITNGIVKTCTALP